MEEEREREGRYEGMEEESVEDAAGKAQEPPPQAPTQRGSVTSRRVQHTSQSDKEGVNGQGEEVSDGNSDEESGDELDKWAQVEGNGNAMGENNTSDYNPSDNNPSDHNPSDYNPSDPNPSDPNPSDYNPSDYNPSNYNPSDYNPSSTRPY